MPEAFDRIRAWERWPLVRSILVAAVFVVALIKFATVVHTHDPIEKWLFWRYARAWGAGSVWTLACLVAGHALIRKLLPRVRPVLEHLVLSFALGLFSFFLLMFLCGLLHLYGPALFFGLPLLMIAGGAWPAWRYGRRLVRHLRFARSKAAPRPQWWRGPLLLFAFLGTLAVYLPVLLPDNAAFDACWYHLPIAEHYVAAGGIVPFKEGWHLGAFPHLASILYTWAFLQPATILFDRVELCAHLELIVFLWTLASVPLLVRQLIPRSRASWSWVVMYLFPGLFVYDSSLLIGADHIAAFWAVPIYVALLRTWKRFDLRWAFLTAVFIAAALNTKYTAFSLALAPIAAMIARFLFLWIASMRRRAAALTPARVWVGLAVFAGTGVLMTAPHWAKNQAFYGDPLYPALWRHLQGHPWTADAGLRYAPDWWAPTRDLSGLWETARALWSFSFVPNDWEQFHGKVPVFGSLFTLTLLALPLLRGSKRLWWLAASTLAGVFAWYTVSHQDRYLQVIVPWMAACTASVIVLVWRTGWIARVAVIPLIAMQLVWAIGVYFIPSHNMLFQHPLRVLTELGGSWFRKSHDERLERFGAPSRVGKVLDKKSDVVLVHEKLNHLGLRTRSVTDHPRFQSGISYARLGSPREVWELYRWLDVTHVLFAARSDGSDSYASDLVFWDFAQRYTHSARAIGGLTLASMPSSPPPDQRFGEVVGLFVCRQDVANGLYRLGDLNAYPGAQSPSPIEKGASGAELDRQALRADFVIYDSTCRKGLSAGVMSELTLLTHRESEYLYVKRTAP